MQAIARIRVPAVAQAHLKRIGCELLEEWRNQKIEEKDVSSRKPYKTLEEALTIPPVEWKRVAYQTNLDVSDMQWENVRQTMLRFENLWPPNVAHVLGDWNSKGGSGRLMQPGDSFVQSVMLFPPLPKIASMWCMDHVAHVYDDANRGGSTVVASNTKHDELGEHSIWVRRIDDKGTLVLESVSSAAFKSHIFGPGLLYAEWLRARAHTLGKEHVLRQLNSF